jgi:hypothetical protein
MFVEELGRVLNRTVVIQGRNREGALPAAEFDNRRQVLNLARSSILRSSNRERSI